MSIFKNKPCEIFYNEKSKTFNLKGFALSFENVTGGKLAGNLGEIDYASVPPDVSDQLRTQAEIHYQICNTIHALPKGSTKQVDLMVRFAEHLMEMEKILVSILSSQKKKPARKKS